MSNFPVYHGITIAANAYIENFTVESLASDPVPVLPGRSWYNTTEKQWKFSTLDATGAVIVKTFASKEALDTAVSDINATIGTLGNLVTTDKADIVSAVNEVKTQVNNLGSAFNYVGTVVGGADVASAYDMAGLATGGKDVGDYYKVATSGYFKVGAGAEFYANANDGLVFNLAGGVDKIDSTDSSVSGTADFITVTGSTDTGYTVDVAATFKGRMTTAEGDIDQLQTDVGTVGSLTTTAKTIVPAVNELAAEVKGKIGTLTDLTTDAKGTIVAAINEVDAHVDAAQTEIDATQTGAGLGTDGTYTANGSTNYLTAATSLKSADELLDSQIKSVRTSYAAQRKTYSSTSAATTHTFAHNLNDSFVSVAVWVQRADGSWRNDVVGVKATDTNTVDLFLSSAAQVRIIVTSSLAI